MNEFNWVQETTNPDNLKAVFKHMQENLKGLKANYKKVTKLATLSAEQSSQNKDKFEQFLSVISALDGTVSGNKLLKIKRLNFIDFYVEWFDSHHKDMVKTIDSFIPETVSKHRLGLNMAYIIIRCNITIRVFTLLNQLIADTTTLIIDTSGVIASGPDVQTRMKTDLTELEQLGPLFVERVGVIHQFFNYIKNVSNVKLTAANQEFFFGSKRDALFFEVIVGIFALGVLINAIGTSRVAVASAVVSTGKMIKATTRSLELLELELQRKAAQDPNNPKIARELILVGKAIQKRRNALSKIS